MQEDQIRTAPNRQWQALTVGDANAEHDIYDDELFIPLKRSRRPQSPPLSL
jgi:hypothetical protein